jgi:hypothetical protein
LLREADDKHGWQLKKKTEEVAHVRMQTQTRMERLAAQKKSLAAEVKTGKKSKEEEIRAARMEHREHVTAVMGQVKASQKLAKSDMHEEKERHSEEVAKLKQQTTGLRNHMKNQREKHKEMMCAVTTKYAALEALCSVSEVENKKLVRKKAAQQLMGATLVTKTAALEAVLSSMLPIGIGSQV